MPDQKDKKLRLTSQGPGRITIPEGYDVGGGRSLVRFLKKHSPAGIAASAGHTVGKDIKAETTRAFREGGGGAKGTGAALGTATGGVIGGLIGVPYEVAKPAVPGLRALGEGMHAYGKALFGIRPDLPLPRDTEAMAAEAEAEAQAEAQVVAAPPLAGPAGPGEGIGRSIPGTGRMIDHSTGREIWMDEGGQMHENMPFQGQPWSERGAAPAGRPGAIEVGDPSLIAEQQRRFQERNPLGNRVPITGRQQQDPQVKTFGDMMQERLRLRRAVVGQGQMQAEASMEQADDSRARTAIDKGRAHVDAARAGAEIQERSLTMQEQQTMNRLQQSYLSLDDESDPDGKRRSALARKIQDIQGKSQPRRQVVSQKGIDPETGFAIETPYVFDDDGTVTPLADLVRGRGGNSDLYDSLESEKDKGKK